VNLVASFTVLADIAREVGGDYVEITSIVGVNSDTHVYRAHPADAKKIVHADILVMNGLGFEGWLERLVQSSGFDGVQLIVSDGIESIHHEEHDAPEPSAKEKLFGGHSHVEDPHAWHSLHNGMHYAQQIAQALTSIDPDHADYYQQRLDDFLMRAEQLDDQLRQMVATLPEGRRRVITSHDAFSYLGAEYNLEFISPQNVSTESEASARDVADLIRQIREEGIVAVFLENISDDRLMQQIANETGTTIGGTLYSGALSDEDGPASTYLDMMRYNVTTLVEALSER
jgi:zinc/manganese transport system substrate-binding protein